MAAKSGIVVKKVVTHVQPHLDEITAYWLLRKFGEEKFPGIESAELIFWSQGRGTPDGRPVQEYEKKDHLFIGTAGGSLFDEHPLDGEGTREDCSVTLVAKHLGIADPRLKEIIAEVAHDDLEASSQPFDLPSIIKVLNYQHPDQSKEVVEWGFQALEVLQKPASPVKFEQFEKLVVEWLSQRFGSNQLMVGTAAAAAKALKVDGKPTLKQILGYAVSVNSRKPESKVSLLDSAVIVEAMSAANPAGFKEWLFWALDAKLAEQIDFHETAAREFKRAQVITLRYRKRDLKVVVIESSCPSISKFARSKQGCEADIVIQRQPVSGKFLKGNVQIFTNQRIGLDTRDMIRLIRIREQEIKFAQGELDEEDMTTDWDLLESEGTVSGAEEWYYLGGMYLNGSFSAPDVPCTWISLDEIVEIVKTSFADDFDRACPKGSCNQDECERHHLGLLRCRTRRFIQKRR